MSASRMPPPFQFSLRWMMIAVAIVAVALGLGTLTLGLTLFVAGLLLVIRPLLPTVAVAGAIYGRGDLRAFAIGGVVCSIPMLTTDMGSVIYANLAYLPIAILIQLIAMASSGVVCVATRRWLIRRGSATDVEQNGVEGG